MIHIIVLSVKPTNGIVRYRGVVICGKAQKVRSQETSKRVSEVTTPFTRLTFGKSGGIERRVTPKQGGCRIPPPTSTAFQTGAGARHARYTTP
jgi:hypothetical protein